MRRRGLRFSCSYAGSVWKPPASVAIPDDSRYLGFGWSGLALVCMSGAGERQGTKQGALGVQIELDAGIGVMLKAAPRWRGATSLGAYPLKHSR